MRGQRTERIGTVWLAYEGAATHAPSLRGTHTCVAQEAYHVARALSWCSRNATGSAQTNVHGVQACYLLGLALRKQFKFAESSRYLGIALEAAYEARDSIRDDIWREVAACKFAWWSVQSQVRRDKRARLQRRLHAMMDEHYRACPSVRASAERARCLLFASCKSGLASGASEASIAAGGANSRKHNARCDII